MRITKSGRRNNLLKWSELFDKTMISHVWLTQEMQSIIDVEENAIKIMKYSQLHKRM